MGKYHKGAKGTDPSDWQCLLFATLHFSPAHPADFNDIYHIARSMQLTSHPLNTTEDGWASFHFVTIYGLSKLLV